MKVQKLFCPSKFDFGTNAAAAADEAKLRDSPQTPK
jgi:hypothetical protein